MLLAALAGALGAAACGTTGGTEIVQPITGVVVRAETLSAGRGCGTAPTQLFKYVVLVFGLNPDPANVDAGAADQRYDDPVGAGIYDCFTDGTFVDLPTPGGSSTYRMEVYAYNRAAYDAAGGFRLDTKLQEFQSNLVAYFAGDAGATGPIGDDVAFVRRPIPTYSTKCTAQQLSLVQSLAVCEPLTLGRLGRLGSTPPASIAIDLGSFKKVGDPDPDPAQPPNSKYSVRCGSQYVAVRYSSTVGGVRSLPQTVPCGAPGDGGLATSSITIQEAQAPASYVFDLALLGADGTTAGSTTCRADTSPGLTSVPVCTLLP